MNYGRWGTRDSVTSPTIPFFCFFIFATTAHSIPPIARSVCIPFLVLLGTWIDLVDDNLEK